MVIASRSATSRTTSRRSAAPPVAFNAPATPTDPPVQRRTTRAPAPALVAPVEPTDKHPRPAHHKGLAVVSEERIGSLPNGAKFKISKLELADGSSAFACWECTVTGDTRGDIMAHRNADHGARIGKNRATVTFPKEIEKDPDLFDLVLPVREDGTSPGDNPMYWQLGEVIAIMPTVKALGDLIQRLEEENDKLLYEVKQTRVSRADQHKIDVYTANQAEIVELRSRLAKQGNYEQVKEELYALKKWKSNIIKKLKAVGFQLSEEDE